MKQELSKPKAINQRKAKPENSQLKAAKQKKAQPKKAQGNAVKQRKAQSAAIQHTKLQAEAKSKPIVSGKIITQGAIENWLDYPSGGRDVRWIDKETLTKYLTYYLNVVECKAVQSMVKTNLCDNKLLYKYCDEGYNIIFTISQDNINSAKEILHKHLEKFLPSDIELRLLEKLVKDYVILEYTVILKYLPSQYNRFSFNENYIHNKVNGLINFLKIQKKENNTN